MTAHDVYLYLYVGACANLTSQTKCFFIICITFPLHLSFVPLLGMNCLNLYIYLISLDLSYIFFHHWNLTIGSFLLVLYILSLSSMCLWTYWNIHRVLLSFLPVIFAKILLQNALLDLVITYDHTSTIPIISSGLKIIVSVLFFTISNTAVLHVNFNFINMVL